MHVLFLFNLSGMDTPLLRGITLTSCILSHCEQFLKKRISPLESKVLPLRVALISERFVLIKKGTSCLQKVSPFVKLCQNISDILIHLKTGTHEIICSVLIIRVYTVSHEFRK